MAAVLTVIAGYAAVMLVLGPAPIVEYARVVLPSVTDVYRTSWQNLSLWSVGWRVFQGTRPIVWGDFVQLQTTSAPLVAWPFAARALSFILPLVAAVAACVALLRIRSFDASLGLMVCVSLLTSPISWDHYRVLTAIPIAVVFIGLVRRGFPSRQTNLAIVLASPSLISFPTWAMLAFWADGQQPPADFVGSLSFGASLLTLGPAAAVIALGFLVASLRPGPEQWPERGALRMVGPRDSQPVEASPDLGHLKRSGRCAPPEGAFLGELRCTPLED